MENTSKYYEALVECADRYDDMLREYYDDCDYWGWNKMPRLQQASKLLAFITTFREGCLDGLPLNKLNRWLGYIQGCLIAWDITTVEAERDWTRPLFRPLDFGVSDEEV